MTELINSIVKLGHLIVEMRKRDMLLIAFVFSGIGLIGVLSGHIKVPAMEAAMLQHATIMEKQVTIDSALHTLIDIERLGLYLNRETCLHGADTEIEKARCDRADIREAITEGIFSTIDP